MALDIGTQDDRDIDTRHNGGPQIDDELTLDDREGWVRVSRRLRSHWLVGFGKTVEPFDQTRGSHSRSEAWMDLIMECRYAAGTVMNGGRKMEIRPGQLLGAISWLAQRWNWSPKTVRTFLDKLEDEGMIERFSPGIEGSPDKSTDTENKGKQKGKQASVVTISKYEIYQFVRHAEGQAKRLAEGTQGARKGHARGNIYKEGTREQGNKGTREQAQEESPPTNICGGDAANEVPTDAQKAREPRGSRLDKDWKLPKSWGDWALDQFQSDVSRVRLEGEKFRDHWHSKAGTNGRKLDWEATWRNWVRNSGLKPRLGARTDEPDLLAGTEPLADDPWEPVRAKLRAQEADDA